MLECLILGDSIAVGTQAMRHECVLVGKGGINSRQFNKNYAEKIEPANTVIISLGSNDHDGVNMVQIIAKNFGDTVLPITRLQPDKVHPSWAGYKELSTATK